MSKLKRRLFALRRCEPLFTLVYCFTWALLGSFFVFSLLEVVCYHFTCHTRSRTAYPPSPFPGLHFSHMGPIGGAPFTAHVMPAPMGGGVPMWGVMPGGRQLWGGAPWTGGAQMMGGGMPILTGGVPMWGLASGATLMFDVEQMHTQHNASLLDAQVR